MIYLFCALHEFRITNHLITDFRKTLHAADEGTFSPGFQMRLKTNFLNNLTQPKSKDTDNDYLYSVLTNICIE